jgi:hypothetical protein
MKDIPNKTPKAIEEWLLYDTWSESQSLCLIAGLDPNQQIDPIEDFPGLDEAEVMFALSPGSYRPLGVLPPFSREDLAAIERLNTAREKASRIWETVFEMDRPMRREHVIQWARSKRIEIPWLDFANKSGWLSATPDSEKSAPDETGIHKSDLLQHLNQAATRFWRNIDPSDKQAHPSNSTVAKWLVGKGYLPSLAKHGATIIRPTWAAKGRIPNKE